MRIVNLMDDIPVENGLKSEHGLSFYIETNAHKILFDTGATDAYIYNAHKLNIKLEEIDTVILSHGHYDHCGGVLSFAKINDHADIYMQKSASDAYYNIKNNKDKYIGIDKDILKLKQLKILEDTYKIDEELLIFKGMKPDLESFKGNLFLKRKVGINYIQDDFNHEQCLIVKEHGANGYNKNVLISGCAHNGITSILQQCNELYACKLDAVFSGFHMIKDGNYDVEEIKIIKNIAYELMKSNTTFYTGHCTGKDAYLIMKEIMKQNLNEISVGSEWII